MEPVCERCGASPAALIDSSWQLGLIIYRQEFQTRLVLCRPHARSQTTGDLIKTLLLGWWGVISVLTNTIRVPLQISECIKAHRIPEVDTDPQAGGARRGPIAPRSRNSIIGLSVGAVAAVGIILVLINVGGSKPSSTSFAGQTGSAAQFDSATPYYGSSGNSPAVPSTTNSDSCGASAQSYCPQVEDSVPATERTSETVVQDYFAAINRHDYQSAYALGGSNLDSSYKHFAAGFATTAHDTWNLNETAAGGTQVYGELIATHTDGTTATYGGYYVVAAGLITSAHLVKE